MTDDLDRQIAATRAVDPVAALSAACEDAGSQLAWCSDVGVSPQYVSAVLTGKQRPGKAILRALGLERVVTYRWKETDHG